MRRFLAPILGGLAVLACLGQPLYAASLRVAPVILDLRAPAAASTIRVWNEGRQPINIQVRVFRWTQRNGEDVYEHTSNVVASPPMATLTPGGENIIRVVRTADRPVQGEENYRVIVDELPDPTRRQANTVDLLVRHAIPVFFADPATGGANPSWSVTRRDGGYVVTVRNAGGRRLKVSNLTLSTGGSPVARRKGLVGYALGNSTASWFIPGNGRGSSGGTVSISADTEAGSINATARLQGG